MADNVLTTAFGANPLTDAIIERYMYEKTLSIATKNLVFWKLGRMVAIPAGQSKTITFERFERLVAPKSPLSEGVTPTGKKMTVTKVPAIAEQWGDFVTLTDVVELTLRHQPVQRAIELIGLDAAETVDREVQRVLMAGTNDFFPNGKTRATLTESDVVNTSLMRKVVASLRRGGAPAFEGNRFVGVCDPECSMDVQADGTFVPAAQYSNLKALQEAEVGIWGGVRWMESNNIPVVTSHVSDLDPTTMSTPVADNGSTGLAAGDYTIRLVGLNETYGFETDFGQAGATQTAAAGDAVLFTVPTMPTGVSSVNVYVKKDTGSFTLQATDIAAKAYSLNLGGDQTSTTGIAYSSSGRVALEIPAASVNVHTMYIFGKEYYSVCELKGIQVLRTPPGPQKGDELDQRRSIGWKCFFKAVITNDLFGAHIECASNHD